MLPLLLQLGACAPMHEASTGPQVEISDEKRSELVVMAATTNQKLMSTFDLIQSGTLHVENVETQVKMEGVRVEEMNTTISFADESGNLVKMTVTPAQEGTCRLSREWEDARLSMQTTMGGGNGIVFYYTQKDGKIQEELGMNDYANGAWTALLADYSKPATKGDHNESRTKVDMEPTLKSDIQKACADLNVIATKEGVLSTVEK